MMRLGRRASLLVAFYLFASAATAYAECAWVLWERAEPRAPSSVIRNVVASTTWQTVAGYDTRVVCWNAEDTRRRATANIYVMWRNVDQRLYPDDSPRSPLLRRFLTSSRIGSTAPPPAVDPHCAPAAARGVLVSGMGPANVAGYSEGRVRLRSGDDGQGARLVKSWSQHRQQVVADAIDRRFGTRSRLATRGRWS